MGCKLSDELLDLTKSIRIKRMKQQDPQRILNKLFSKVDTRLHSRHRSWDKLVELLARYLALNDECTYAGLICKPFEGLVLKETKLYLDLETLLHIYVEAARRDPWDHIGELYTEQNLVRSGQNMTPKGVVEMMIQMTYAESRKKKCKYEAEGKCKPDKNLCIFCGNNPLGWPVTQIDPCTGTGRFLWYSSILNKDLPLVLYGIEINLSLYRGCLVNMALFSKHPYSIVCGDALMIAKSDMWDLGNKWNPPSLEDYYWKPPPIRKNAFSLKAFTEIKNKEKS